MTEPGLHIAAPGPRPAPPSPGRAALWRCLLVVAGIASILAPSLLHAGITGTLEGRITDAATGAPLPGANVALEPSGLGAATDADGFYRIHNIRAGRYEVRVTMIGYRPWLRPRLVITPDRRFRVDAALEASPIDMPSVEVTGQSPLIETDVTGTAYQVQAGDLTRRPVDGVEQVVAQQPAITAEGHVRGGRTHETVYLVDGLAVQDVVAGGLGVGLPVSAISQMTVQTGGFEAEYGNALSGVVNVVTRTGGDEHDVRLRIAKDDLAGGDEVSRRNEAELTVGGPVPGRASYFTANNLVATDTRWWQDFQHFFDSPVRKEWNGLAKVDWQLSPSRRLTLESIYSLQRWRDYEFSWRYDLDGLPTRLSDAYRTVLHWSDNLSGRTFYTVSLSRFWLHTRIGDRDPTALTPYDYDFYLLYVQSGDRAWRADSHQRIYTLKSDVTHQLRDRQLLKAGLELNQYDIDADIARLEPQTTYYGRPMVFAPMLNYSTRYDYRPRSGSAYAQTKIDAGDQRSVLTAGLRLDFLDPRAQRPAVELIPTGPEEYAEQVTGYVPADLKVYLSPRLGASLPLAENTFFFVNIGQYVQFPLFDQLYAGLDNVTLRHGVNVLRGNPDLDAERTVAWELSVRRNLERGLVASVAYFHKETRDQIDSKTFVPGNSRIAGDYGFAEYVNTSLANAEGFEFVLQRPRGRGVRGTLSYVYMQAEGLSDAADQGLNLAQWGFPVAATPYALSWDQRHTFKADVELDLPLGVEAFVTWQSHSGRPYTYFPSDDGFTPDEPDRPFVPNNRRMPSSQLLGLRLDRGLRLWGDTRATLYVDSRNLLDERNVRWIDASGRVGGELADPGAYDEPRRTMVGLRVDL